jgi:hypothetical protein
MNAVGNEIIDLAPVADRTRIQNMSTLLHSRLLGTRSTFVTPESTQENPGYYSEGDEGAGTNLFPPYAAPAAAMEEQEDPNNSAEEKDDQAGGKRTRSTRKRMRNKRASKRKSKRMNKKRRGSRSKRHY